MDYHTPLSIEVLRQFGIPEPWTFGTADRVRFGEIDALNHVNHTAYLRWFETFRITYFREYGISNYDAASPRIVLKSIAAEFIKEMVVAQDYIVTGRTSSFRNSSWVMEYGVWTNQGLQTTGSSVLVQLDPATGAKMPLSQTVREALISRDNATPA
ncbi:MAG: thioesterase family protein [Pseudomonadota bacterium]